jgi:hypothetical protein
MGMLRPFIVHMRLRVYIAYVLLDAVAYIWGFGQVYGLTQAVSRWGLSAFISVVLCWAFELYMRRLFIFSLPVGSWQPGQDPQRSPGGGSWPPGQILTQQRSAAEVQGKVKSV